MKTINKGAARLFIFLIKYLPVFRALLFITHLSWTISGRQDHWLANIVKISPCSALIMIVASYAFGFCKMHRHITYYNFVVSCLMVYYQEFGMANEWLFFWRLFCIIMGIILLGFLYVYRKNFFRSGNACVFRE